MQKYFDSVLANTSNSVAPVRNASVTVRTSAGALATIYSDNGVTVKPNPVKTDVNGFFEFYAADGRYNLTIEAAGLPPQVRNDVILEDPVDGFAFTQSGTGAVQRTALEKLRESVSVLDFGAKGDGVTDDTPAFLAAQASGKVVIITQPEISYSLTQTVISQNFILLGVPKWTNASFVAKSALGLHTQDATLNAARFERIQDAERQELVIGTIYSSSHQAGSRGSYIKMYGNRDLDHAGNIALVTGQDDLADARVIVSGGCSLPASGGFRTNTDTRVTIGNSIYDFVDTRNDSALLTLKNPIGRPALYITEAASDEGDIATGTGERLSVGHWSGTVFTERFGIDPDGRLILHMTGTNGFNSRTWLSVGGVATIESWLQIAGSNIDQSSAALFNYSSGTTSAPHIFLGKSLTDVQGGQARPTSGTILGAYTFGGSNGTGFATTSQIRALASANWTATSHPTYIGFRTTFANQTVSTEVARITETGAMINYQAAEAAQNTSATLSVAQLQAGIITSNAAVTLTLPTGTALEGFSTTIATNTAFDVVFIATTANAITIAANGNATVGSLTVNGNESGTFRFRKTATNTFTVYRVA